MSSTVFHPGVNHAHSPSGRWADVQANPNSPGASIMLLTAYQNDEPTGSCKHSDHGRVPR